MEADISVASSVKHGLGVVTFEEALDEDLRPVFVLDLTRLAPVENGPLYPLFCNRALAENKQLHDSVLGFSTDKSSEERPEEYQQFREWISRLRGTQLPGHSSHAGFRYDGVYWTSSMVRGRYQIVSGNVCEHTPAVTLTGSAAKVVVDLPRDELARDQSKADNHGSVTTHGLVPNVSFDAGDAIVPSRIPRSVAASRRYDPKPPPSVEDEKVMIPQRLSASMSTDWTAPDPLGVLTPHEIFARNTDWASTPLGPMSSWSPEFREVVNLLMRNPHPATLFWGEELTMVYNDAYRIEVAGNKHPRLMGSGFFGPFAELWESVRPIFQECARTGKSIRKENDRLLIERYGYLEETFFSWSWTPLYGGTDRILGFYNAPFETTYQTVGSRRMETLRHLGERVAPARSVKQFWRDVLIALDANPYDIPFASLYSITDSDGSDACSVSSGGVVTSKTCALEGTIGVPDNHPAASPEIDLSGSDGLVPCFEEAIRTREPVVLRVTDGNLPDFLLEGISFRGFGIPSKEALVVPIRPTSGQNTTALLMIGLNPRRQYDSDYRTFITMLNRQLASSLASVVLLEDEARRNRTAAEVAALQREQLTEQLALQTSRLRRMTEFSPFGMMLVSPDGVLLEGNDRYYEMTNHSRDIAFEMSFMDTVADASKSDAITMWVNAMRDLKPTTGEIQLSNNYNTEINELTGRPIDCWVLASVVPEIGPDGTLRSVLACITDISHMRWAQGLQDQRLREAEETKRQQNAFIDITSHEMRNPLSAVLICADDIRDTLTEHHFSRDDAEVVKSCIEAASTIALCVQHQKSIVDDILTISKLNSNLLVISPMPTEPVRIIQEAMSMFRNEANAKEIDMSLHLDPSLEDLNIQWLMLDPGRLVQMTINLITNAIKFTKQSPKRSISVFLGASLSPPVATRNGFQYVPTREAHVDVASGKEWGNHELVYLRVKVADTGCGLTEEEKQRLFERFAQASPRTHAHYGGSGLGLFISRQLAELHGGQIGAASEAGQGSTFGFFIQCRKTFDPVVINGTVMPATLDPSQRVGDIKAEIAAHDTRLESTAQDVLMAESQSTVDIIKSRELHVLVVEDNLVNQKLLRKGLEKMGCTVNTADNGVVALRYLETTELYQPGLTRLSVILMDLEMPEMDGLTCIARIRELEAKGVLRWHVPAIAVTANVRAEQVTIARNSGMDDIVSKPFRIAELVGRIEALVSANRHPAR